MNLKTSRQQLLTKNFKLLLLLIKMIITFNVPNQSTLNNRPQIKLSEGNFNKKSVVFIDFEFNWDLVNLLRNYSNSIYIGSEKRWYILKQNFNLNHFFNRVNEIAFVDYSNFKKK